MEQFYKQGEFTHDSSNPFLSFVSSVLDITIIKPIIDGCIGKDLITGEDLTDMERGLKVVFAMVDLVTLGGAIAATKNSSFANKNLGEVLKQQGLTLEEFNKLRLTDVSQLTNDEKALLKMIRESIPMPDSNTLMQKVIPASDVQKYLDGTYTQIGGFVTRAEDVTQLKTYDDIYNSLRLDYPDTAYDIVSDDTLAVIRYNTNETSKIQIPYSSEMGGVTTGADPFTGNGFTKATNGQIIPEYKMSDFARIEDGAQLIEIGKDGIETLKAIYDVDFGRFVPIE